LIVRAHRALYFQPGVRAGLQAPVVLARTNSLIIPC
jgi:hypothetical protein